MKVAEISVSAVAFSSVYGRRHRCRGQYSHTNPATNNIQRIKSSGCFGKVESLKALVQSLKKAGNPFSAIKRTTSKFMKNSRRWL